MNKILFIVVAFMVFAGQGFCQETAQMPKELGGVITGGMFSSAIVEAIDYITREVTLRNAAGETLTVVAGPEVRNFAQINKGDKVNIDYSEKVKVVVSQDPSVIARQDIKDVVSAPLGEKPAGVMTDIVKVAAKVEAIDYEGRSLTLKGPEKTVTIQVDENTDVPDLNEINVGDMVYLEYAERLAISVDAQAK